MTVSITQKPQLNVSTNNSLTPVKVSAPKSCTHVARATDTVANDKFTVVRHKQRKRYLHTTSHSSSSSKREEHAVKVNVPKTPTKLSPNKPQEVSTHNPFDVLTPKRNQAVNEAHKSGVPRKPQKRNSKEHDYIFYSSAPSLSPTSAAALQELNKSKSHQTGAKSGDYSSYAETLRVTIHNSDINIEIDDSSANPGSFASHMVDTDAIVSPKTYSPGDKKELKDVDLVYFAKNILKELPTTSNTSLQSKSIEQMPSPKSC